MVVITSAHVSKSSLSGSVGTTSADTGNTSDGSSSSPGFGGSLVTSLARDGVGLTSVLVQVLEHILNQIGSDRGSEDGGELDGAGILVGAVVYGNYGTSSLCLSESHPSIKHYTITSHLFNIPQMIAER